MAYPKKQKKEPEFVEVLEDVLPLIQAASVLQWLWWRIFVSYYAIKALPDGIFEDNQV